MHHAAKRVNSLVITSHATPKVGLSRAKRYVHIKPLAPCRDAPNGQKGRSSAQTPPNRLQMGNPSKILSLGVATA
jgi:hypothetical protein